MATRDQAYEHFVRTVGRFVCDPDAQQAIILAASAVEAHGVLDATQRAYELAGGTDPPPLDVVFSRRDTIAGILRAELDWSWDRALERANSLAEGLRDAADDRQIVVTTDVLNAAGVAIPTMLRVAELVVVAWRDGDARGDTPEPRGATGDAP